MAISPGRNLILFAFLLIRIEQLFSRCKKLCQLTIFARRLVKEEESSSFSILGQRSVRMYLVSGIMGTSSARRSLSSRTTFSPFSSPRRSRAKALAVMAFWDSTLVVGGKTHFGHILAEAKHLAQITLYFFASDKGAFTDFALQEILLNQVV